MCSWQRQRGKRRPAARLPTIAGVELRTDEIRTFCSHESCPSGNDRHIRRLVFDLRVPVDLDSVATEYELALDGWTRDDFCGKNSGAGALEGCVPPDRPYVELMKAKGRVRIEFGQTSESLLVVVDSNTSR